LYTVIVSVTGFEKTDVKF